MTSLVGKLVAVVAAIDAVEKRGRNREQGYDFVRAVDVAREVRAELAKVNVLFTLTVETIEHRLFERTGKAPFLLTTITGTATFRDGDSDATISLPFAGTGGDYSGDKGLYKAITGATKYALRSTFLIPDEADDPEVDQVADQAAEALPPVVGAGPKATTEYRLATDRQKHHLRALGREKGLTDEQFKATYTTITGKASSKDMTEQDYTNMVEFLSDIKSVVSTVA